MSRRSVLCLNGISKAFPGVLALDDVSLDIMQGEVHALVGENGAGKSTLIKVITGAHKPDSGTLTIDDVSYDSMTPLLSKNCGVAAVYQEFNLVDSLTVAENIFLGNAIHKGMLIDRRAMEEVAAGIFNELGLSIDPGELVKNLSVGHQQLVEIAKAVAHNAKILIMDEPSAPLTTAETESMFKLIDRMTERGMTIIYISHRLSEIFRVSNRVTVMRDGHIIKTLNTPETSIDELISLMVGRILKKTYPVRKPLECLEPILEVRHVTGNGVHDINFKVNRGEILGLAGLVGAGRTELAELIFGVKPLTRGEIIFKGEKANITSPHMAIDHGIALVPEDRKRHGALLHMSVAENISIAAIRSISERTIVNRKKESAMVDNYVSSLRIKTPTVKQTTRNLSGGNQQKVVLAKSLAVEPDLIIFDEPTRGIDVGAKQEIYNIMNTLVEQGKTIIMISSEMEELIGMSDRIIVLSEGHVTGELSKEQFNQETILRYASHTSRSADPQGPDDGEII